MAFSGGVSLSILSHSISTAATAAVDDDADDGHPWRRVMSSDWERD